MTPAGHRRLFLALYAVVAVGVLYGLGQFYGWLDDNFTKRQGTLILAAIILPTLGLAILIEPTARRAVAERVARAVRRHPPR